MAGGKVEIFMKATEKKTAQAIKGKNVLIVHSSKFYRGVTELTWGSKHYPGFVSFICDGVRIKTNAEIIITETA